MKPIFLIFLLVSNLLAAAESSTIMRLRSKAEQGLAGAQFNLGEMYANGYGVPKDLRIAADWYRKSAEQGYGEAEFGLGMAYLQGLGVAKNEVEGFAWIAIAAPTGGVSMVKFHEKLLRSLDGAVIAAGHARSKELIAQIKKRKRAKAAE